MRHSILDYDQAMAVRLKLDMNDLLLIRWFVDFKGTELMKQIIVDNQVYYWVHYQTVLNELPILRITNTNVLRRRFKKLCDIGILKFHCERNKQGTYTYYNVDKAYVWLINFNK